jgi:copper chaperone CopZ
MPRDTSQITLRYGVGNLHCGGCVGRAEAAMAAVPGVIAAQVNLATKRAILCMRWMNKTSASASIT